MDSFLSWIGGKKLLRNAIISEFPNKESYNTYVEVFGGAGWVLFHKEKHALKEIYNDINSDLVNLFKCVKYHTPEMQRELNFMLNSREMFEQYLSQFNAKGLTDIQRASRYYLLVKLSYGSTIDSYGATKKDVEKMKQYILQIQKRLTSVVIENKTFEKIITKYDKQDTLFYIDPPYHSTEFFYNTGFDEDSHILLCKILKNLKGKFVLSYNDDEFIKNLYRKFTIIEIERNHNLTSRYNKNRRYKELIIKNF
ncbi:DNA adenine methylase [Criibacterium bergeronii]|uniref:site-specific DNA-methyltransferase (adenine-specific) n=1 Tax=Criibacterium bergeronii TaxID=1871336 RepID=A0A552V6V2_9FIRM|nr:DNA adenine methylase [Criibacterium bergeronii]TRW26207.1 DNA adenine methylase [Criibacterium bergeronii]